MSSVFHSSPGTGPAPGGRDAEPGSPRTDIHSGDGEREILRTDPGYSPTPQPVMRRRRSFWATAPATYILVGINCAVFLAMMFRGVSPIGPTPDQLMHWGANNA